jgi:hypothetical protein
VSACHGAVQPNGSSKLPNACNRPSRSATPRAP